MIELIEVLDPISGQPTDMKKPKELIHRDGDWHRAVHVWIITPKREIVLQQRSRQKENNPGLWDVSCAGHVSAGESVVDAAIRETEEDLGLTIEAAELKPMATTRESSVLNHGAYIDNEIHEVFVVRRAIDLASLRLQPGEVDDVRLVTGEELRKVIRDPSMVDHGEEYELLLAYMMGSGL